MTTAISDKFISMDKPSGVPAEAPRAVRAASYATAAAGDPRGEPVTAFPSPSGMCLPHERA